VKFYHRYFITVIAVTGKSVGKKSEALISTWRLTAKCSPSIKTKLESPAHQAGPGKTPKGASGRAQKAIKG